MKHTEALQQKLYDEMLSRIKETDVSVPYRENGYLYWTATEKGKSYPIFMRHRAATGAADEVVIDANALAAGKKFSQVGSLEVSPGGSRAAYLHDTTALRVYTLYVKDLTTGKLLGDSISRVVPSVAWANDTVFFYQTADSARRSDAVWRHVLGTPVERRAGRFMRAMTSTTSGSAAQWQLHRNRGRRFTSSRSRADSYRKSVLRLPSSSPRAMPERRVPARPHRRRLPDHHQRRRAELQGDAHRRRQGRHRSVD